MQNIFFRIYVIFHIPITLAIPYWDLKIFILQLSSDIYLHVSTFQYCAIIQQSHIMQFIYLSQNNHICEYIYIFILILKNEYIYSSSYMINSSMMSLFYQFNSMICLQRGYRIPGKISWDSNQGYFHWMLSNLVLKVKLHEEFRFVCEQERRVVL